MKKIYNILWDGQGRLQKWAVDKEGPFAEALLRIFTFGGIFLILPPVEYFQQYSFLQNVSTCTDFLSYPFRLSLSEPGLLIVYGALKVSLLFSAAGAFFGLFSFLSFGLFSALILHTLASCYSNHLFLPLGMVLLIWAVNGNQSHYSLDHFKKKAFQARESYVFTFLKINFALIFLFTGLSKLRAAGWDWVFSDNLKNILIMQNYFHARLVERQYFTDLNALLITTPGLSVLAAFTTILVELSAGILLITRKYDKLIVSALFLLQICFLLTMYINFYPWIILYLVWVVSWLSRFTVRTILPTWPRDSISS